MPSSDGKITLTEALDEHQHLVGLGGENVFQRLAELEMIIAIKRDMEKTHE